MMKTFNVISRHFYKNRAYTILNLLGLAAGFAAFIFAAVYVYFETNFESFHENRHRIYRATYQYSPAGGYQSHWARIPFDYINNLPLDIPGVKTLVRFQNHARKYVRIGNEKFKPTHAYVTDNDALTVFNFELIAGNAKTALTEPHSAVITQSLARKYFSDRDPIGAEISVIGDLDSTETLHRVTGVMKDLPANTHLPVEMLLSFRDPSERTGWAYTYIMLEPGTDINQIASQMPGFVRKYSSEEEAKNDAIVFQPLPEIHLQSNLAREIVPNSKHLYVSMVGFTGLFIVLIAAINFMNLNSAMALGRAKEVGMRKIMGATRRQLVYNLLAESVAYNLIALILGASITWAVFPVLQQIITLEFLPPLLEFTALMTAVAIVLGLATGIYPVTLLTTLKPVAMLKTTKVLSAGRPEKNFSLKRVMLTLQFSISILLLGSAFIAYQQIEFLRKKNLGLQREQIIAIPGVPDPVKANFETFRQQLENKKGIIEVSACMEVPSREIRDAGPVLAEGINSDPAKAPMMDIQVIDHEFASVMGLSFIAGKNVKQLSVASMPVFTESYSIQNYLAEQPREYLINETAMRQLGWQTADEAIGQKISWSIGDMRLAFGAIAGVVKDFHQESLKNKVDPVVMVQEPIWLRTFLIKAESNDIPASVATIQSVWSDLFPAYPMEYYFLDDLYNNLYKGERTQLQLLFVFSGLAILIAFIGLVGLVAYALKTRTKELAVRQVLGAQLLDLISLLSREYIAVLLIGTMIAIPVSVYALNLWLRDFAYRVAINPASYVLAFAAMIGLLFVTVGLQTFKASRQNPARTLREE
jgi:putative ABC transport system permease protein